MEGYNNKGKRYTLVIKSTITFKIRGESDNELKHNLIFLINVTKSLNEKKMDEQKILITLFLVKRTVDDKTNIASSTFV